MTSIIYEVQLRQHFPLRSHQGVCDTPLQFLAEKRGNAHRKSISKHSKSRPSHPRNIGKYVGAQRHTPSRERTMTSIIYEVQLRQHFPLRSHQGVCDTPLQFLAEKRGNAHRKSISKHSKSRPSHPRNIGKYVGAQRHTPSRERTMTSIIYEVQLRQPIPLRSHQGVCDTPL